jgi:WD40 repeat protein
MKWRIAGISLIIIIAILACFVILSVITEQRAYRREVFQQLLANPSSSQLQLVETVKIIYGSAVIVGHQQPVVAFSNQGITLGSVNALSTSTELGNKKGYAEAFAFSTDDNTLVSVFYDIEQTLELWDISSKTRTRTFTQRSTFEDQIHHIAISNSHRSLVTVGWRNRIEIWDLQTGALLRSFQHAAPPAPFPKPGECIDQPCVLRSDHERITGIAASHITDHILVASSNGYIRAWSINTGQLVYEVYIQKPIYSAPVYSADGSFFAISVGDSVQFYNAADGQFVRSITVHTMPPPRTYLSVESIAFSNNLRYMAVGSSYTYPRMSYNPFEDLTPPILPPTESTVSIFELTSDTIVASIPSYPGSVSSIMFTSDGKHLIGSEKEQFHVWNINLSKK